MIMDRTKTVMQRPHEGAVIKYVFVQKQSYKLVSS